jgi:hypothetical protein
MPISLLRRFIDLSSETALPQFSYDNLMPITGPIPRTFTINIPGTLYPFTQPIF